MIHVLFFLNRIAGKGAGGEHTVQLMTQKKSMCCLQKKSPFIYSIVGFYKVFKESRRQTRTGIAIIGSFIAVYRVLQKLLKRRKNTCFEYLQVQKLKKLTISNCHRTL
jgi:hypothetical protein